MKHLLCAPRLKVPRKSLKRWHPQAPKGIVKAVAIQHGQKWQRFIVRSSFPKVCKKLLPAVYARRCSADFGKRGGAVVFHHSHRTAKVAKSAEAITAAGKASQKSSAGIMSGVIVGSIPLVGMGRYWPIPRCDASANLHKRHIDIAETAGDSAAWISFNTSNLVA